MGSKGGAAETKSGQIMADPWQSAGKAKNGRDD